jgi:hypothetical protein
MHEHAYSLFTVNLWGPAVPNPLVLVCASPDDVRIPTPLKSFAGMLNLSIADACIQSTCRQSRFRKSRHGTPSKTKLSHKCPSAQPNFYDFITYGTILQRTYVKTQRETVFRIIFPLGRTVSKISAEEHSS